MATLGCSQHVAYIQDKCAGPRLCELLDISSLGYDRRLDDISEAFVEIPISGDMDSPCCSCLGQVEPWCHVLTIVREGDGVVWTGPVQRVVYGYDKVRIEAKDKLVWLKVRVNKLDITGFNPNFTIPLTTIALDIATLAMESDGDSPCFLDCVQNLGDGLPPGTNRSRETFKAYAPSAMDDFQNMADSGVDYTVMGQCLILSGTDLPAVAVGTLLDEHILGDVSIIKDGDLLANSVIVRYTGDDTGACAPPAAPCPAVESVAPQCYGLVEKFLTDLNIPDLGAATVAAQTHLNLSQTVPRRIEFPSGTRLSPDTPWALNDMIPGQRMDVSLTKLCIPIFQSFKIQIVTVSDGPEGEQIGIELKAQVTD